MSQIVLYKIILRQPFSISVYRLYDASLQQSPFYIVTIQWYDLSQLRLRRSQPSLFLLIYSNNDTYYSNAKILNKRVTYSNTHTGQPCTYKTIKNVIGEFPFHLITSEPPVVSNRPMYSYSETSKEYPRGYHENHTFVCFLLLPYNIRIYRLYAIFII